MNKHEALNWCANHIKYWPTGLTARPKPDGWSWEYYRDTDDVCLEREGEIITCIEILEHKRKAH